MKTKAIFPCLLLGLALSGTSCSKLAPESPDGGGSSGPSGPFVLTARKSEPATRLTHEGLTVKWAPTDKLRVYNPAGESSKEFATGADRISPDGLTAEFTGPALTAGQTYRAVYPFERSYFDFRNQNQVQAGNTTAHLALYDCMYSDFVTVPPGAVSADFTFHHMASQQELKIALADGATGDFRVTGVILRAHDAQGDPVNAFCSSARALEEQPEYVYFSSKAALSVSQGPALTRSPDGFSAYMMVINRLEDGGSYPYSIDVAVTTTGGDFVFPDAKTVSGPQDEFQAGYKYVKTLTLDPAGLKKFPDESFREVLTGMGFVEENGDIDPDNATNEGLFQSTTSLNINRRLSIFSLQGLEYFTALTELYCQNTGLTSLDVSKNTALKRLNCNITGLTTLDVSKNTALERLDCQNTGLTALDVSKNTALVQLACGGNSLTTLDVSQNTALEYLNCNNTALTTLDVSANTALTYLACGGNSLTALDLSKNTALVQLVCGGNSLTTLDVSANTALKILDCSGTGGLTALDLSKNTALTELYCQNTGLTALDVSKNTALKILGCYDIGLTALDLSKNTALEQLVCDGNSLTTLDLSKNTALERLDCSGNGGLTALDLSKNTALTSLDCSDTGLTSLDVSKNTALEWLDCSNAGLTSLDVSKNTALGVLLCYSNRLTELRLPSLTSLTTLACGLQQGGDITAYLPASLSSYQTEWESYPQNQGAVFSFTL